MQYPFSHGTRPSLEKKGDGILNVRNNVSVFCAHEGEMGANECVQVLEELENCPSPCQCHVRESTLTPGVTVQ